MKPTLSIFHVPRLTGLRVTLALIVALVIDGLQFFLGPFGWVIVDQVLDVVGMVLTNWILGFHILLLPTFIVKLVPLLDELPTWTACVAAVIVLRRREQQSQQTQVEVPGGADFNSAGRYPAIDCPPVISEGAKKDPSLPP